MDFGLFVLWYGGFTAVVMLGLLLARWLRMSVIATSFERALSNFVGCSALFYLAARMLSYYVGDTMLPDEGGLAAIWTAFVVTLGSYAVLGKRA